MPITQCRGGAAEFRCQFPAGVGRIDNKTLISRYYSVIFGEFLPDGRDGQGSLCGRLEPDVAAAEALGPPDLVDRGICPVAGGGDIAAECGDAEHPAAIGEDPLPVAASGGVKDLDLGVACRGLEAADLAA